MYKRQDRDIVQREHGKHAAKEKPQKPKKSRLSRQQKCLVAVAVILAVALAGVAAYKALFIRPDLNNNCLLYTS